MSMNNNKSLLLLERALLFANSSSDSEDSPDGTSSDQELMSSVGVDVDVCVVDLFS